MIRMSSPDAALQGGGDMEFLPDSEWLKLPDYWALGRCSDVAVDSRDRVWVGARGDHAVSVWNSDGSLSGIWSTTDFEMLHGLNVTHNDEVWVVDAALHVARKYSPGGETLLELGKPGVARPTVTHSGEQGTPFNMPTAAHEAPDGTIYVSDGYGNRQVHRFDATGELLASWGRSGTGPGEFSIVHSVTVDASGRVIVADRENNRIQIFDPEGEYLTEIDDLLFPAATTVSQDLLYVVEMGLPPNEQPNGFSVFDAENELVGRWYLASIHRAAC